MRLIVNRKEQERAAIVTQEDALQGEYDVMQLLRCVLCDACLCRQKHFAGALRGKVFFDLHFVWYGFTSLFSDILLES